MKKVAFISGCFDGGLHRGHLHILQVARDLVPDGLVIIAINHDAYLARKGPGRPLRALEQRRSDLYATGLVDEVIAIEDSPLDTILALKPDYIVVGDDYTEDRVVGAKECKNWGGQIVIDKTDLGFSTTAQVIDKIGNDYVVAIDSERTNGGQQCDMEKGPCACGAWH